MFCTHCGIKHNSSKCRVCKNGLDRYGLTRLDMLEMHKNQNGKCKLCEKHIDMFVGRKGGFIDHNHKTGEIKGIICLPCNTTLGYIENKLKVKNLIEYMAS